MRMNEWNLDEKTDFQIQREDESLHKQKKRKEPDNVFHRICLQFAYSPFITNISNVSHQDREDW